MNENELKTLLQNYIESKSQKDIQVFFDGMKNKFEKKLKKLYSSEYDDAFQEACYSFMLYIQKKGIANIESTLFYFHKIWLNTCIQLYKKNNENKSSPLENISVLEDTDFNENYEKRIEMMEKLLTQDNTLSEKCKKILTSISNGTQKQAQENFIKEGGGNRNTYYQQTDSCKKEIQKYFLEKYPEVFNLSKSKSKTKKK